MHKTNHDIKELADAKQVRMWMVADHYGLSESNFCKKLRYPLSASDKDRIVRIINAIADEEV